MSMGGTLTAMTIESQPDIYAGALSLCGAIEPSDRLMQRDFALRAAFDYYFPNVLGPLVPVPATFMPTDAVIEKVKTAMHANPKAARSLLSWYGVGDANTLPDVIVFNTFEVLEMQQRIRGNPFGNADLIYTNSGDDFALNAGVAALSRRCRGGGAHGAFLYADRQADASAARAARYRRSARAGIDRVRVRAGRAACRQRRTISCSSSSTAKATVSSRPKRSIARSASCSNG